MSYYYTLYPCGTEYTYNGNPYYYPCYTDTYTYGTYTYDPEPGATSNTGNTSGDSECKKNICEINILC